MMPAAGAKIFVFLLVLYVFSSLKALSLKRICAGNHAKFSGPTGPDFQNSDQNA